MMRDFGTNSDNLSNRTAIGGGSNSQSGSRDAFTQYSSGIKTNSFPALPSLGPADLALLRAPFYSRVQQALADSFALLFCVSFVIVLLLSIPLAIFLLFFAL